MAEHGPVSFGMLDRLPSEEAARTDQAIEIVRRKFADHRLRPAGSELRLTVRTGRLDGIRLHFIGYGAPVTIDGAPLERFRLLCIPLAGRATMRIGGREWHSDPVTPVLLPPDREFRLVWLDGSPQFVLYVPCARLTKVANALFGGSAGAALRLPPTLSLRTSAGRALRADIAAVHEDINSGAAATFPPFLRESLIDGLIARLLYAASAEERLPLDDLSGPSGRGKLVAAFLELAESPASAELTPLAAAAVLGVPLRTLQEHLRRELHASPSQVLTRGRLRCARRILQMSDPTRTSVTEVALRCGFRHQGRFSVRYREAFGEKPSETLVLNGY